MLVRKGLILLFSIFFWTFAFTWMGILSIVTLICLIFLPYPKVHHRVPAPGFSLLVRLATLGRFQIECDPRFDPKRPSVFCMNHTNLLDAHTASAVIPLPFCGLMNSWQFWIPFYGWLMKHSRGIPVKGTTRSLLSHITNEAIQRKSEGMSILVFPEAHRTDDGRIQPFKQGVFFMARDAGYPVVPLAVKGMFKVNHKGSYLFSPAPVSVYVGSQLETAGLKDSEIGVLAKTVQGIVNEYTVNG